MSKVTILPYESPRCIVCGRNLPRGRTQKCYTCRPIKTKLPAQVLSPEQSKKERYTIDDCVALASAYGISYGQVVAILETGYYWPPQKRSLAWPEDSVHLGEK